MEEHTIMEVTMKELRELIRNQEEGSLVCVSFPQEDSDDGEEK